MSFARTAALPPNARQEMSFARTAALPPNVRQECQNLASNVGHVQSFVKKFVSMGFCDAKPDPGKLASPPHLTTISRLILAMQSLQKQGTTTALLCAAT
jgi:hypothetical protein